jgi:hypothetical protein
MATFADSFNLEITGLLDVRTLNRRVDHEEAKFKFWNY